jgi:hypothetical protein
MEHFHQIKVGMTADEVEDILGAPPGKFGMPDGWLAQTWFRWKGRKGNLRLTSHAMGDWQRRDARPRTPAGRSR